MIAVSIFGTVVGVALQQFDDSVRAATYSTVQGDLRRMGQDILGRIAQDLRSTQAQFVGPSLQGDTLELSRIGWFNGATQAVVLEQDASAHQIDLRYTSPATLLTPDGRYQILQLWRGDAVFMAGNGPSGVKLELSRELAPGGFQIAAADAGAPFALAGVPVSDPFQPGVSGLALPGAYTSGGHFEDRPVLLAIRITLRRRMGLGAAGEAFTNVNMQTEVQLRPSQTY
jgi:hypothetical protein